MTEIRVAMQQSAVSDLRPPRCGSHRDSIRSDAIYEQHQKESALIAPLPEGRVISVASSLTATLKKICEDLTKIRQRKPEVNRLWFYTPRTPTTQSIDQWRERIQNDFGVELQVITREETVGRLL